MAKLDRLFQMMKEANASDLHVIVGALPKFRVLGELEPIAGEQVLTQEVLSDMLMELLDQEQKAKFLHKHDLDFAYSLAVVARFRCNYYVQKLGYGAVFR